MLDDDSLIEARFVFREALDRTAKKAGVPRQALLAILRGHCIASKNKWEAELWRSAQSDRQLDHWVCNQAKKFQASDNKELLDLAEKIPDLIRKRLTAVTDAIPAPHGGKPPRFDPVQRMFVAHRVRELRKKMRLSKEKAYEKVAKKMNVGAHTIRRACEPKERERSRRSKVKELAAIAI